MAAAPNTTQNDENTKNLVELMDNLNMFITTSTKLVNSIKTTVEAQNPKEEEGECTCSDTVPTVLTVVEETTTSSCSSPPPTPSACPPCSPPAPTPPSPCSAPPTPSPPSPCSATPPAKSPIKSCTAFPVSSDEMLCPMMEAEMDKPEKDTTPTEGCNNKAAKAAKERKEMMLKIKKERCERTCKLKETLKVIQKNLTDIQEQIRQLDRLYEDFESYNTPDGEINPAALYKEIMKPEQIPATPKRGSKPTSTPKCPNSSSKRSGTTFLDVVELNKSSKF